MTKFSSFLVFLFGALLLVVLGVTIVQRFMPGQKAPEFEGDAIPHSDLPALVIESSEVFHAQLDSLYKDHGGLDGVRGHVEKEFVPGRTLILASTYKTEPAREFVVVDREVRRCDGEGAVMFNEAPVVSRASATLRMGKDGTLQSWSRLQIEMPFVLNAWCLPKQQ